MANEENIIKGGGQEQKGRAQGARDPLEVDQPGLGRAEHVTFSFIHRHSGLLGDGRKVGAGSLDTSVPFPAGDGPIFLVASGNKYRLTVVEVKGEDGSLSGVIELVPVA